MSEPSTPDSIAGKVKRELGTARAVLQPSRLQHHLDELRTEVDRLADRVDTDRRRADDRDAALAAFDRALTNLMTHVATLTEVTHANTVWSMVERATHWASIAPLMSDPAETISVVMPTHNRSALLRAAVASVTAQSYTDWQLVIVDDASADDTPAVIAELMAADDRIVTDRTSGLGPAGARNVGLAAATGTIVTFLDDDNLMMPHWLRGIAEYTGRVPGWKALYGAQLRAPHDPEADPSINVLFEADFDADRLRQDNFVDLGALAVRADHPELRFDTGIDGLEDWDLAVRLAGTAALTALPVLASCYSYAASDRVSTTHNDDAALQAMRDRFAR